MRRVPITDTDPDTLGRSVGHHLRQRTPDERSRFLWTLFTAIAAKVWKHRTRGSVYDELFRGTLQMSGTRHDMASVIVYRSVSDGSIWVRKVSEFMDGRFEEVTNGEAEQKEAPRS
jgi:plasmid stabilization system protein ParE